MRYLLSLLALIVLAYPGYGLEAHPFQGVPVELVDHLTNQPPASQHRFRSGQLNRQHTLVLTVDAAHMKATQNGLPCTCPKAEPATCGCSASKAPVKVPTRGKIHKVTRLQQSNKTKKPDARPAKPPPPSLHKIKKAMKNPHHEASKHAHIVVKHSADKVRNTKGSARNKLRKMFRQARRKHKNVMKKQGQHIKQEKKGKLKSRPDPEDDTSKIMAKYGMLKEGSDQHLKHMVGKLQKLERVLKSSHESMRSLQNKLQGLHGGQETRPRRKIQITAQQWNLDTKDALGQVRKYRNKSNSAKKKMNKTPLAKATRTMLAILHRTCAKVKRGPKRKACAKTFFLTYKKSCSHMKAPNLKKSCFARLQAARHALHHKAEQVKSRHTTNEMTAAAVTTFCSHLKKSFAFRCVHKFGRVVWRMCRFMVKQQHRQKCSQEAQGLQREARKRRANFLATPHGKRWLKRGKRRKHRRHHLSKKRKVHKFVNGHKNSTQAGLVNWAYNKCKRAGGKNCGTLRREKKTSHTTVRKISQYHTRALVNSKRHCVTQRRRHGKDSSQHHRCQRAHARLRRATFRRHKKNLYPEDKYGPLVPAWFKIHKHKSKHMNHAQK